MTFKANIPFQSKPFSSQIEYVNFLIEAAKLKNPGNVDPEDPERQKNLKNLAARISEAVLDRDAFIVRRFVGYSITQPKGAFVSVSFFDICKFL
jgi:hypothetical protein